MTGCDGNMAADVADGATHPSSPTIRKKYVAIMMMIIVVINMRIMIMVRMRIMIGWSQSSLVYYNMEEGMQMHSVTTMILIMRCFAWQFTKVVFWPDCVRMKLKFEQRLLN